MLVKSNMGNLEHKGNVMLMIDRFTRLWLGNMVINEENVGKGSHDNRTVL